jgi:hypothetical protein
MRHYRYLWRIRSSDRARARYILRCSVRLCGKRRTVAGVAILSVEISVASPCCGAGGSGRCSIDPPGQRISEISYRSLDHAQFTRFRLVHSLPQLASAAAPRRKQRRNRPCRGVSSRTKRRIQSHPRRRCWSSKRQWWHRPFPLTKPRHCTRRSKNLLGRGAPSSH